MTLQELENITQLHEKIAAKIREGGFLRLSNFSSTGIDPSLYLGVGPKRWISEMFPEFIVDGSNEVVFFAPNPFAVMETIIQKELKESGKLLLSMVPQLLSAHGYQYKDYSNGQRLSEWLFAQYPDLKTDDNNLWLLGNDTPKTIVPIDENADEVQQMHSIAFMNWWSVNLKNLRKYNSQIGSEESVRATVAHNFAYAILGKENSLIFDESENRVAFKTGLYSSTGEIIYCVLIPNPKNNDGTKQAWAISTFACPDDDTAIGRWLKGLSGTEVQKRSSLAELKDVVTELETLFQRVADAIYPYYMDISAGRIPSNTVSEHVTAFETALASFSERYQNALNEPIPEGMTISQLSDHIGKKNEVSHQISSAIELFCRIAEDVHKMLVSNRFATENKSTPLRDIAGLREYYADYSIDTGFEYFEGLLTVYHTLMDVMRSDDCSPEIENKIEYSICTHFKEVSYRNARKVLVGSDEEEWKVLEPIEEIERIVEECKKKVSKQTAEEETNPLYAKELLKAISQSSVDGIELAQYAKSILPCGRIEQMILFAQFDELTQYAHQHEDSEQCNQLLSELSENDLPTDLTFCAAAARFEKLLNDGGVLAEKYYILGLKYDGPKCGKALLDIYRKRKDYENYSFILQHFVDDKSLDIDNRIFYLSALCSMDEDAVLDYAYSHFYLFYLQDSVELLCALSNDTLSSDEKQRIRNRCSSLMEYTSLNPFESAVLCGDYASIKYYADAVDELHALGYTDEIIARIAQAAQKSSEADCAMDNFSIGVRFYNYQKNTHSLAERYLWAGIAEHLGSGAPLMLLLAQEQRYGECCNLFECFQKEYSKDPRCQQFYTVSRLKVDPEKAKAYVRANLQDCLQQMQTSPAVKVTVKGLADKEDSTDCAFYTSLLQLNNLLGDPLLKALALQERTLREFATPEYLKGLDVEDAYVNRILNTFKMDVYSHGKDAISISERIFTFVGAYANAAELFAKFELPEDAAIAMLWTIYSTAGKDDLMFGLLYEYPQLQAQHYDQFIDGLFQRQMYEEFISEYAFEAPDLTKELQYFIAQLKICPSSTITLPISTDADDVSSLDLWIGTYGELLFTTLAQTSRYSDIKCLLLRYFEQWITVIPSEKLSNIVSCCGAIPNEVLKSIQEDALSTNYESLALYIYNILGIGDLAEAAASYLKQKLAEIDMLAPDLKLHALRRTKAIFGERFNNLDNQIALLEIEKVLSDTSMPFGSAAEIVASLIDNLVTSDEIIDMVSQRITSTAVCYDYRVCKSIERIAERTNSMNKALQHFHQLAIAEDGRKNTQYMQFVCSQYISGFVDGIITERIIEEAYSICYNYASKTKNTVGIFCLYFMEKHRGNHCKASFILREMADLPTDVVGERISGVLSKQLEAQWENQLPSYLALFKEMFETTDISSIPDFLSFAGSISIWSRESASSYIQPQLLTITEDRILSESDCNDLIRLLYVNASDPKTWKLLLKLPLQDSPVCYAKIQILASGFTPGLWEECSNYCYKNDLRELLVLSLSRWSREQNLDAVGQCRLFIEKQLLLDSEFLTKLGSHAELIELSKVLCDRVKPSEADHHATIRALSLIAEKTGEAKALDYLFEKYSETLLGKNSNLAVVTAAHLLLDKRFQEAHNLLVLLNGAFGKLNYRSMVSMLAALDVDKLQKWCESSENEITLQLILPDGNRPNIKQIANITYSGILHNKALETANVLQNMLKIFPDDYGLYNSLLDLCSTKFEGYIACLHRTLRGLSRLVPSPTAQRYYPRGQKQYIRLLAALDAVLITSKTTSQIEDYTFNINTGDFYGRTGAANTTPSEIMAINNVRNKLINTLSNLSPDEQRSMCQALLSYITGNWHEFLITSWNSRKDISREINISIDGVDDVGFARSIIRALVAIEQEERSNFIRWLKEKLNTTKQRQAQFSLVEKFVSSGSFEKLYSQDNGVFLRELSICPFEDYSLMPECLIVYVDQAIKNGAENLFETLLLIGAFVRQPEFMFELVKKADKFFDDSNDLLASKIYRTLLEMNKQFSLTHQRTAGGYRNNTPQYQKMREQYEARYRITSLFSGSPEMIAKLSSPTLNIWTCINLVLTLLYSKRADEVHRLASYFSQDRAVLAKSLVQAMDPSVNDKYKVDLIDSMTSDLMKAYFCYVVKYPFNPGNLAGARTNCYALTQHDIMVHFNQQYVSSAKMVMAQNIKGIQNFKPIHILLVEAHPINANASRQKDPLLWASQPVVDVEVDLQDDIELPFYAKDLPPIDDQIDIASLHQKHRELIRISENAKAKADLSRKALQAALNKESGNGTSEVTETLLLYGCDEYYVAIADGDIEKANQILFAVSRIMRRNSCAGYGAEEIRKLLPDGLFNLMYSFATLSDLLSSYGEHKSIYQYLRGCVNDVLLSSCVGTIFEVLDSLQNSYTSVVKENPETLREVLSQNYFKVAAIESNRWIELKNKVLKLINVEIYELDRRPFFQIEVLNLGLQQRKGYLYGIVHNIGQIAAEKVSLQANYSDNSHSKQYILDYISPGAEAAFQIDYSFASDTETIDYFVTLSFMYEDKLYSPVACKGTIKIGDVSEPSFPVLTQNPNGMRFSINAETKEVYNPNFVGRKNETALLRGLLSAGDSSDTESCFALYKSAIMYGIRRSGKSSLLNYFATYLESRYDSIIRVMVDCQTLPEKNCIHSVFVDSVIYAAEMSNPELRSSDEWLALKERWNVNVCCMDENIQMLVRFYPEVRQVLNGKGFYLLIDEADRLFEKVESSQANLDSLFGALSAMLSSLDCRESVHFVICGSNWLIRYNLRGDSGNQLLQRFDSQIEVGKLDESDTEDVVKLPYKKYPELIITQEALNWIRNYTGGLVWHTRLLGDTAIARAKKAGRHVVYPYDVQQSLPEVLSEKWCKQFYEGCESGNEYRVVDAMQSIASRRNMYIHINQLCDILGWEAVEVQKILSILKALRVVSPNQYDPDSQQYRFDMDIYRRYFRTQVSKYTRIAEEADIFRPKESSFVATQAIQFGNLSIEESSGGLF